MTDPFEVLGRTIGPSAPPRPAFVAALMRAVEERLDTTTAVGNQAPPGSHPSEVIDTEVDHMHRQRQPQRRWLLAAAAVVLVVLAALALTRQRGSDDEQPAGTTTPDTAAVDPTAMPAALQQRWAGDPRDATGAAGALLVFDDHSYQMSARDVLGANPVRGIASPDEANTFDVVSPGDDLNCDAQEHGTYGWALSATGYSLTLTAIDDPCAARVAAMTGTYRRAACLDPSVNCLGPMDAGAVSSHYAVPVQPSADAPDWTPRFAGVSFTVPEGWANTTDVSEAYRLAWASEYATQTDAKPYADHELTVVAAPRLDSGECQPTSLLSGDSAASMLDAIDTRRGITVGERQPIEVGGRSGLQVDLTVDDSAYVECEGASVLPLLLSYNSGFGALEGQAIRLIVLDGDAATGTDRIAIVVQGTSRGWDQFLQESMDIIGTMQFA